MVGVVVCVGAPPPVFVVEVDGATALPPLLAPPDVPLLVVGVVGVAGVVGVVAPPPLPESGYSKDPGKS